MPSKLIKKGSELYGKRKGDPMWGLKAMWGGKDPGPDRIAAVSEDKRRNGVAPKRGSR